ASLQGPSALVCSSAAVCRIDEARLHRGAGLDAPVNRCVRLCGLELARRSLAGALVVLQLIRQRLAFVQPGEAGPLNGGNVNKDVAAASVRRDETETLGGVEPLNNTSSHFHDLRKRLPRGKVLRAVGSKETKNLDASQRNRALRRDIDIRRVNERASICKHKD